MGDNKEQTIALIEKFLISVLHLVSERYTEGIGCVTEKDCLKKEIIQLLCIKPMKYSQFYNMLKETNEKQIHTVSCM